MDEKNIPRFPATNAEIAASIAASLPSSDSDSVNPKIFPRSPSPPTSPGSARGTPPPNLGKLALGGSAFVNLMNLNPSSATTSRASSRRPSTTGTMDSPIDSRRGSVKSMATDAVKDMKKGVKNVADTTKKASHKVKDKTAGMSAHMMVATKGAGKWVTARTGKRAKAAMDQAKSGLSGGEKCTLFMFEKISVLSKKGFTHVFMFLVLIGYTALGALLFMALEAPHEKLLKWKIHEEKMDFIKNLWDYNQNENNKNVNYPDFQLTVRTMLLPFEDELCRGCKTGVDANNGTDVRVWTFWKSMFFCSTITTTIGYGHIAPKTATGQALTIVYALFGIPIFLILMADFGKLFTRLLKALFIFIRKCYRSATCVRLRKHKHVNRTTDKLIAFKDFIFCRYKDEETDEEKAVKESKTEEQVREEEEANDKYFEDGNFNLPVSLALFILIVYMVAGCVVYVSWEDWTYFEAFYFIFISMTTIGFGDYVPAHPGFMMASALYLVFGLALTAMCINIIQEKLTDTFREASTKLKDSFGNIMAQSALAAGQTDDEETPTQSITALNTLKN